MPWQFEPKKDACLSAKTTMSPLIDVINRWFPNGATPFREIGENLRSTGNSKGKSQNSKVQFKSKKY